MTRRVRVAPGKKVTLPSGRVLNRGNELIISDTEFATDAVKALVDTGMILDLGAVTSAGGGNLTPIPSPRITGVYTTKSLAKGVNEQGNIVLSSGFQLISLAVDKKCRVRLYTSAAKQVADVHRASTTPPTLQTGLILEYVTGPLDVSFSPGLPGVSLADPPTTNIPITVTNLENASSVITVTVRVISTGA